MARKLWQLRVDSVASIECSAEEASIMRASTNPARVPTTTLPAETRRFFIPNGNAPIPADYQIGYSCPIPEGRESAKSLNLALLCGWTKMSA